MSRSHSVKSSEVRSCIRFRIRSLFVLRCFSPVISDGCWRRSWGNRWTFNGWERRMYGLSPTSVVRIEKSGDDGADSFVFSVWLSGICCVVVVSFVIVTSCITTCYLLFAISGVSCSSICFPKSISHDTAYHSLCDTLTSGSGRCSFARTVTSGTRCSGT